MKPMKELYETIVNDITVTTQALLSKDNLTDDDLQIASKMLEKASYFKDLAKREQRQEAMNR